MNSQAGEMKTEKGPIGGRQLGRVLMEMRSEGLLGIGSGGVWFALVAVMLVGCQGPERVDEQFQFTDPAIEYCSPQARSELEGAGCSARADSPKGCFEAGLAWYRAQVKDYQCRFTRVERLGGELTPWQVIAVSFLDKPFAVYMEWVQNPRGASKVLYVDGWDRMRVQPSGLAGLVGVVEVDPHGDQARSSARSPITRFGFEQMLERIVGPYDTGELTGGGAFRDRFAGFARVEGEPAVVIERHRLERDSGPADAPVLWRFYLDCETMMPVAVTQFGKQDELLAHYRFTAIEWNVGLTVDGVKQMVPKPLFGSN